jgi:predicted aspartyl protease
MILSRRNAAAGLLALVAAGEPLSRARAQQAPAPLAQAPAPSNEPPTEVDTGRDAYEHMLAPVTINGQGPFQFLIDTGANVSCVSRTLADRLMLADLPPARVHTPVGVRERPGVLIEQLQVGERRRRDVRAAALSLSQGLDGVLGIDWLAGQRLEMGFRRKSLAITRSKRDLNGDGVAVVPARRRYGQLTIVDADLGGRNISAMIDSGSQMTLCNAAVRDLVGARNARRDESLNRRVDLETLVGEPFSGEMLYLPFLRLGGLQMGNVPVVCSETHVFEVWGLKDKPAVVLGMDLLTQFDTVALDFGHSQVRFELSAAQRTRA